tara:strand:- start:311 stop:586 length:276 start_codon:yes stop_codon:yes gene_type:complete
MILKAITTGQVGTTASIQCPSGNFSISVFADGTNQGTYTVKKDTSSGDIVFEMDSDVALSAGTVYSALGATVLHLTVAGTNATAQVFEAVA